MTDARKTGELSTLDDLLAGDGTLEGFQAIAIKEVIAWQAAERSRYLDTLAEGVAHVRTQPVAKWVDVGLDAEEIAALGQDATVIGCTIEELLAAIVWAFRQPRRT